MADKDKTTRLKISPELLELGQNGGPPRLSDLQRTLVKGSQWKKRTLGQIEAQQNDAPSEEASAVLDALKRSLMDLVERNWRELVTNAGLDIDAPAPEKAAASSREQNQSVETAAKEHEEIGRLQKEILSLVAKNTRLSALQRQERDAHQAKISKLKEKLAVQSSRLQKLLANREEQDKALSQLQTDQAASQSETLRLLDANVSLRAELVRLNKEQSATRDELSTMRQRHDEQGSDLQALSAEREALAEELLALQTAYEQFQRQSDEILNELEAEVSLLRGDQRPH